MTTAASSEQVLKLYQECGGDLQKVAERLGVPHSDLVAQHGSAIAPPTAPPARRRPPPDDLGHRKGGPNPKFIIAVRHADNPVWPRESQKVIELARANYEAGTHEMVQGRDRDWFVLYSIPRKQKTEPRKFFHAWV